MRGSSATALHQQHIASDEEEAEHSDEQSLLLRGADAATAIDVRSSFSSNVAAAAASSSSSSAASSPCTPLLLRRCLDWRGWPLASWVRRQRHPCAVAAVLSLCVLGLVWALGTLALRAFFPPERLYPPHAYRPHPSSDWTVLSLAPAEAAQLNHHLEAPMLSRNAFASPLRYSAAHPPASLTIVTAATEDLFLSLENLIGSVHAHAPNHRVLVYDLDGSLTPEQITQLHSCMNVQLIALDIWLSPSSPKTPPPPSHLTDWKLGAFKPIIMLDALTWIKDPTETEAAASTAPATKAPIPGSQAILYLDADMELTSYPGLIERLLRTDGYVFVAGADAEDSGAVDDSLRAPRGMVEFLQTLKGKAMLADTAARTRVSTAVMAVAASSPAVESVLRPAAKCALAVECIASSSSSSSSSPSSSSSSATSILFSLLLSSSSSGVAGGMRVQTDSTLRGDRVRILGQPLEQLEAQILFHRGRSLINAGAGEAWETDELSRQLEWAASLPYTDRVLRRTKVAMVIPFVAEDVSVIRDQWAANLVWSPCALPTPNVVDLVFFFSGGPNATLAQELRNMVDDPAYSKVRACFRQVTLQYARLSAQEDIYPAGPTFMFDRLLAHPDVRLRSRGYSHFLLHEADNRPVRANWLDRIYEVVRPPSPPEIPVMTAMTTPRSDEATTALVDESSSSSSSAVAVANFPYASSDWWLTGSLYRGSHDTGGWLLHINGNALYSLSSTFVSYASLVWRHMPLDDYAYDGALTHFLWGSLRGRGFRALPRQALAQKFWHRFRFTDLMQNCWHASCGPAQHIVTDSPNTVLIHTSANVKHDAPPTSSSSSSSSSAADSATATTSVNSSASGSTLLSLLFLLAVIVLAAFVWRRRKTPLP